VRHLEDRPWTFLKWLMKKSRTIKSVSLNKSLLLFCFRTVNRLKVSHASKLLAIEIQKFFTDEFQYFVLIREGPNGITAVPDSRRAEAARGLEPYLVGQPPFRRRIIPVLWSLRTTGEWRPVAKLPNTGQDVRLNVSETKINPPCPVPACRGYSIFHLPGEFRH
jgi:hypothetical protein